MAALIIWGEDDHQVRAKALATTYGTTAQAIATQPATFPNLDTLVFWGHGTPDKFCRRTPQEFTDLVSAWRKVNPGLKTIEMLTCNARHKQGVYADSYTEQVLRKLGRAHRALTFKALPVAVTPAGNTSEFSILQWHLASGTWAYVGAPGADDKAMWGACHMLEYLMPPNGPEVGFVRAQAAMMALPGWTVKSPFAVKMTFDQKQVDGLNLQLAAAKKDAFIMTGAIGLLRWCLVALN